MNIIDYINELEQLYYEIQQYEIAIATAVLIYRALKKANLSNDKQRLARATITELNDENMKKQLKVVLDSSLVSTDNSFETKKEPTYLTDIKDELVFYGSNSTRGRYDNYKSGN